MLSEWCGDTEHMHTFGKTCHSLNLYFWRENRFLYWKFELYLPHIPLCEIYFPMKRIIDNVFNPCLTWDFGTIRLSLFVLIVVAIFSWPHLLFKSHRTSAKLAKNCLCIWASISLFFLFLHPQNLSEVDFLSRILHWWFKSSLCWKLCGWYTLSYLGLTLKLPEARNAIKC